MNLNLEFSQHSCKYIYVNNTSEYDLTLGAVKTTYIKVLSPGQTETIQLSIPFEGQLTLNAKNLGQQTDLNALLQDILEGYYTIELVVTQQLNNSSPIVTSSETFCYYNTCQLDCTIDKKTLEFLQNKCCNEQDCTGKLRQETKDIETLKLYREGLKSSASLCKKETATEIHECLQYKLGVLNIDCGCK
jgi:hypothetical protein